jgi:hypothetical protein
LEYIYLVLGVKHNFKQQNAMKKFVLTEEYLTNNAPIGYLKGLRKPVLVTNDLNTAMSNVESLAQKTLQVRNPNFLEIGKWDMRTDGRYGEIIIKETLGDKDAVRFIIQEVEFILS